MITMMMMMMIMMTTTTTTVMMMMMMKMKMKMMTMLMMTIMFMMITCCVSRPVGRLVCDSFNHMLRDSIPCFVHPSIGWSVSQSVVGPHYTFWRFFCVLSLLLLRKCFSDLLHHCHCPPARDWGSHVFSPCLIHYCGNWNGDLISLNWFWKFHYWSAKFALKRWHQENGNGLRIIEEERRIITIIMFPSTS